MTTVPCASESIAYLSGIGNTGLLVPRAALRAPRVPTFTDVTYDCSDTERVTSPPESGVWSKVEWPGWY
jgi:hypothetical protein